MLKRGLIGLSLLLALSALTAADNAISEWGGAQGGYVIDPTLRWVTITAPGTYKFQALDPNGPSGLGIINHITVDPNCPAGTVSVSVLASDNTNRGALHLREINLTHATDGRIARVFIRGDCAEYGQVRANRIGDIGVDGSVLNDVVVDWLDGGIGCHGAANITVSSGTTPAAQVLISGDYSGTVPVGSALRIRGVRAAESTAPCAPADERCVASPNAVRTSGCLPGLISWPLRA